MILLRAEVGRGDAAALPGVAPRTARATIKALADEGVVQPETLRAPVMPRFPGKTHDVLFPRLRDMAWVWRPSPGFGFRGGACVHRGNGGPGIDQQHRLTIRVPWWTECSFGHSGRFFSLTGCVQITGPAGRRRCPIRLVFVSAWPC
ncbi:MAG: hypothetical protein LW715_09120 [Rhodobacter sp.]|jgi:hypothetical protein|nr:hypothetical protein [Rhodobacter sp.]MCE2748916.1 hypothetical protein [Rhodobacter sp.]